MEIDAVIFDMDGVIVDSEQYWRELALDLYQEATADDIDAADALEDALGMNYREIYDLLADRYEVTMPKDAFIRRYQDAAGDVYGSKVALMDGFPGLLSDIRAAGCATAIASSSPAEWIRIVLDRFDLSVDEVISADELKQEGVIDAGKPDPAVYEAAARALDVEPRHCVVVEDSDNGIRAATRAGMYCIGYRNGSPEADATAASPAELRETLLDLL
ncbi:MAG: HAD family phosphatase [Candidatus Nanohaloarchaea archaeon]|nr:HAD family phosphatase [Candidatus Nanohaloarchaea archaeon]